MNALCIPRVWGSGGACSDVGGPEQRLPQRWVCQIVVRRRVSGGNEVERVSGGVRGVRVVPCVFRICERCRVGEELVGRRAKTELGGAVGRLRPGTRRGSGGHGRRTGVQRLTAAAKIETGVGQHSGHSKTIKIGKKMRVGARVSSS